MKTKGHRSRERVCVCCGLFVVQIRAAAGCELRQLAAQYGRAGKGLICAFMCACACVYLGSWQGMKTGQRSISLIVCCSQTKPVTLGR